MKKVVAMLLAASCMTGLVACSGGTSKAEEYTVQTYSTEELTDEQKEAVIGSLETDMTESEMGDISVNRVLAVNDYLLALYPELDDPDDALETVQDKCSKVLNFVQKQYDLEDLSADNWQDYQENMWACFDDGTELPKWYKEDNDEFIQLDEFFDLYENTSINDSLVAQAEELESMPELLSNTDFMYSIPQEDGEELISQYTEANGSDGITNPYTTDTSAGSE